MRAYAIAALVLLPGCLGADGSHAGPEEPTDLVVLPGDYTIDGTEELARNSTSVRFRWSGTAPVAVYTRSGAGFEASPPVELQVPVPTDLPLLFDATVSHDPNGAGSSSFLRLQVIDGTGRLRCDRLDDNPAATAHCRVRASPSQSEETWQILVAADQNAHPALPIVLDLAWTVSPPRGSGNQPGSNQSIETFLEEHPSFCDAEASCDFWDMDYHGLVVYDLDTTVLDILIVPGATADPLGHTEASRKAVQAWHDGVQELGQAWFKENYALNVYVIGQDVAPPEALSDPEVVVVLGGVEVLAGIGLEPVQLACILKDGPDHAHHGMEIFAESCAGTDFVCYALNIAGAPGAKGERDLYDLVAHEVGHCLGAGHVGDADDFSAQYVPVEDIMSYQTDPDHVHCVSNLNVRILEGIYAHLLGRPEEEFLPGGTYYAMSPLDYTQVECANP